MNDFDQYNGDELFVKILVAVGAVGLIVAILTLQFCARSSVGQSNGLLSRGSQVQILSGVPLTEML